MQAPISKRAGQTHAQHGDRGIGDRERQRHGGERERIDEARGIGHDFHRAHRSEVMRDDRQRQQQCGNQCRADLIIANRARECPRPEHHAEHDRGGDEGKSQAMRPGTSTAHMPM